MGLLLPLLAAATGLQLKPFEAHFQVSRNNLLLGTMDIQLSLDAQGDYRYTGYTKPVGIVGLIISDEVHEASQGHYKYNRITPNHYDYLQDNGKRKKQTELDFDWSDGQVWTDSEGKRWAQPLVADTHDKYSQQLALRLDLAKGAREASYPVADGGKIKTYHYRVVGEDNINLPYGRLKCMRVRRSKESDPPDYTIWVAPELDYMPVKIERQRSSGNYTIELMKFNWVK
jgi:hypothetical protein